MSRKIAMRQKPLERTFRGRANHNKKASLDAIPYIFSKRRKSILSLQSQPRYQPAEHIIQFNKPFRGWAVCLPWSCNLSSVARTSSAVVTAVADEDLRHSFASNSGSPVVGDCTQGLGVWQAREADPVVGIRPWGGGIEGGSSPQPLATLTGSS